MSCAIAFVSHSHLISFDLQGKFSNTFLARLDLPLATLFASQQEGVWHDLINTTVVGRVCLTVRFQGLGQPHGNLPVAAQARAHVEAPTRIMRRFL